MATLLNPFSPAGGLLGDYREVGRFSGDAPQTLLFDTVVRHQGDQVYLTPDFWMHVPPEVWEYTVGGYPVLKTWFDQRRGIEVDVTELVWVAEAARRICAVLDTREALDEYFLQVAN